MYRSSVHGRPCAPLRVADSAPPACDPQATAAVQSVRRCKACTHEQRLWLSELNTSGHTHTHTYTHVCLTLRAASFVSSCRQWLHRSSSSCKCLTANEMYAVHPKATRHTERVCVCLSLCHFVSLSLCAPCENRHGHDADCMSSWALLLQNSSTLSRYRS